MNKIEQDNHNNALVKAELAKLSKGEFLTIETIVSRTGLSREIVEQIVAKPFVARKHKGAYTSSTMPVGWNEKINGLIKWKK